MYKLTRSIKDHNATPEDFWERAGEVGYGEAVFRSRRIERHITEKQWRTVARVAEQLGLSSGMRVLELGCGDGAFTNLVLGPRCASVTAMDFSHNAILRARGNCKLTNVDFREVDSTAYRYQDGDHWDMGFLVGFLHHVKRQTPFIIEQLAKVSSHVVVLEPIGDNPLRKLLEKTPAYREAGEDSFRLTELTDIFAASGYRRVATQRINLFPPFIPDFFYQPLRVAEAIVEHLPPLNRLCSSYVLGFTRDT